MRAMDAKHGLPRPPVASAPSDNGARRTRRRGRHRSAFAGAVLVLTALALAALAAAAPDGRALAQSADRPPEPALTQEQRRAALELTSEELAFIDAHPVVRLGQTDMAFPPLEFVDERGRVVGVTPDYLELVEERLGIEFRVVRAPNWAALLEMARRREVDVVATISRTEEREAYLAFTDAYMTTSAVIITRPSATSIAGLWNLVGRRVAVERGFRVNEHLAIRYPQIERVPADDTRHALRLVARGEADAYVGGLASAGYLIERHQLTDLQIAAPAGLPDSDQRFGVRADWP